MASTASNSSKKRQTFFSHLLPGKTLSIFRTKTSSPDRPVIDNSISTAPAKQPSHHKSQINISTRQTSVPMCMGRGWLKKRSKRPISLDLDLAKSLVQQVAPELDEQPAKDHHHHQEPSPSNDFGTIMDRLLETDISSLPERERHGERQKEKKIDKTTDRLVAKQRVAMSIKQTGKYLERDSQPWQCLYHCLEKIAGSLFLLRISSLLVARLCLSLDSFC